LRAHFRGTLAALLTGSNFISSLASATVAFYKTGTTTPIDEVIYSGPTGVGTLPNPATADASGVIEFWLLREKRFDLYVTYPGFLRSASRSRWRRPSPPTS